MPNKHTKHYLVAKIQSIALVQIKEEISLFKHILQCTNYHNRKTELCQTKTTLLIILAEPKWYLYPRHQFDKPIFYLNPW